MKSVKQAERAIIEAAVALVRQWKSDDCLTYYRLESVLEHAVKAYEKEKGRELVKLDGSIDPPPEVSVFGEKE